MLQNKLGPNIDPAKSLARNERTWRGAIGEALATAYIIEFTDFVVPVLKLRTAHNEGRPLLGDDILAFRFKNEIEPEALLVCEVL